MKKQTNGPGKDSVSISTTIPIRADHKLRTLATQSGLTRSSYARQAIVAAVNEGRVMGKTWTATHPPPPGKPELPPENLARIAPALVGNSMPEPIARAAEQPAKPYTVRRRGSSAPSPAR